jgi:Bax protein
LKLALSKQTATAIAILLFFIGASVYYFANKQTTQPPMTVQEKKARFIELMVPAVDQVYTDLMKRYKKVKTQINSGLSTDKIEELKAEYKVETDAELLMALKPHPKSIALAQAAMESSWATSRFFNEANNIFGVWSFDEDEPRIAAEEKRGDKTIWLKKYSSIEDSIYDYYRTLGRSNAFEDFREARMTTNDPLILVTELDSYSEKGHIYGEELTSIINFNQFEQYD